VKKYFLILGAFLSLINFIAVATPTSNSQVTKIATACPTNYDMPNKLSIPAIRLMSNAYAWCGFAQYIAITYPGCITVATMQADITSTCLNLYGSPACLSRWNTICSYLDISLNTNPDAAASDLGHQFVDNVCSDQ